jgi:spermidine synthase
MPTAGKHLMSSGTGRNISVNNAMLFAAGFSSAAIQILLIREFLSIFSGNELVIGVIFGLWMIFTAIGSLAGSRMDLPDQKIINFIYIVSVLLGVLVIRAVRLLFDPGEVIAPWIIPLIVILTQSDAAFFGGLVYGRISKISGGDRLFRLENAGALVGLIFVSSGILLHWSNGFLISSNLALFVFYAFLSDHGRIKQSVVLAIMSLTLITGFLYLDPVSIKWKYSIDIDTIHSGYNGEIAEKNGISDTLILLNNSLYRMKMSLPSVEQAVHVPVAMHKGKIHRALVIGNMGHIQELKKYNNVSVVCIENEPLLAGSGCQYCAVEDQKTDSLFDVVFLGNTMPATAQSGRFFTESFFKKMRLLAGESGVFSFSLPFGENFISSDEKALKNILIRTLKKAFKQVMVIPGSGYTFVASDNQLKWPIKIGVITSYLENYTMMTIDSARIAEANRIDMKKEINTSSRPIALYFTQKQWLGLFDVSFIYAAGFLILLGFIAILMIPASAQAFSIGSTGLVSGIYSIAIIMLFQFAYGTLYSKMSLLMVALTAGFAAGSFVKKFPLSDIAIGLYAVLSMLIVIKMEHIPEVVFMVLNAGMGFLAAAQFVTRKPDSWSRLYAADLAGGVIGMMLGSTILIPYFGIGAIAIGIGVIKAFSAISNKFR